MRIQRAEGTMHNASRMPERRLRAGGVWPVRLIAIFEALKGALALALGFGVIATFGESLTEAAQELVLGLHLDPTQRLAGAFIDAISGVQTGQIWIVVASALAYSMVRFAEAYGLWSDRRWAAWVSALSGAVYLPIEAYELSKGLSWFRVAAALANVAISAYMVMLLWRSRQVATSRDPDCIERS